MKILVTGSAGFIGKHYVKFLRSRAHEVVEADRKIGLDLTNWTIIKNLPDVDAVIHLAAYNGTKNFYDFPYDVIRDNVLPTQYLLDRYSGKLELFVHAGTCESYAGGVSLGITSVPTPEDVAMVIDDIYNPRWSYGGSKLLNELQVISAYRQHQQNFQIIRFHNVYGPGQVEHFIPELVQRLRAGNGQVYGSDESRSFCYIDDALDAAYQLMCEPNAQNQVFNVGTEQETLISDIANRIKYILNIPVELEPVSGRLGSVKRRCPDITKMKNAINWIPKTTLTQGLQLTIESLL
jgi:nucleoside-diphosphate-sugar epimerase